MNKTLLVASLVVFLIGAGLLLAWAECWFGEWASFLIGGFMLSIGAFGVFDALEER